MPRPTSTGHRPSTRRPIVVAPSTWRGRVSRAWQELAGRLAGRPRVHSLVSQQDIRRRERWWQLAQEHGPSIPRSLSPHEARVHSQNGEDGVLEEIFRRIGTTNEFFVEVGASDGQENCTRRLHERGWEGLWIEADPDRAADARRFSDDKLRVLGVGATPDNIAVVLGQAGAPKSPDLLVVDIDGNDWWVLRQILTTYRPRVLVSEYNASYTPGQRWVRRYRGNHGWDGTFRHGASLEALADLASHAQLLLVGCESAGVNAFFVASEVSRHFDWPGDVRKHYVSPNFGAGTWGHVRSATAMRPMPALDPSELRKIRLDDPRRCGRSGDVSPGQPVFMRATVKNGASAPLTSGEPAGINIALRWRSPTGSLHGDHRAHLPARISRGATQQVFAGAPAPSREGQWDLTMTLVQENVAWLSDLSEKCTVDIAVSVVRT